MENKNINYLYEIKCDTQGVHKITHQVIYESGTSYYFKSVNSDDLVQKDKANVLDKYNGEIQGYFSCDIPQELIDALEFKLEKEDLLEVYRRCESSVKSYTDMANDFMNKAEERQRYKSQVSKLYKEKFGHGIEEDL